MAKKFRCRMGLHRWVETVREKKNLHVCRYCGKVRQGIRERESQPTGDPLGPNI